MQFSGFSNVMLVFGGVPPSYDSYHKRIDVSKHNVNDFA